MISKSTAPDGTWRASELRKLPPSDRDAILIDAAAHAEHEYRANQALTDFEAFGEDDLHGKSTASPAG